MKIKQFLPFFVLFFLMNSDNIFAACEKETAKAEVPVLSAEDQQKLEEFIHWEGIPENGNWRYMQYHGNLLSLAISKASSHPRIVDYVIATQPELINLPNVEDQYPFELAKNNQVLFNKLLERTKPEHKTVPRLNNVLSAITRDTDNVEFAQQLASLGAQANPKTLKSATSNNHLKMMRWLINHGVRDEDGNAIRAIKSQEALNLLLQAGADVKELDKANDAGYTWLYYQLKYLRENSSKKTNPQLIQTALQKLKKAGYLTSVNKPDKLDKTPLCQTLQFITSPKKSINPEAKQKARQVAHILLDYGAVCEDPKLQDVLKEIQAGRISPEVAATMKGSEETLPNVVVNLINEYTGAKLPTEQPAQAEEQKFSAAQQLKQKPTASTSACAQPSSSSSSSATPARIVGGVVVSPEAPPTYVSPGLTQPTQSTSSVKGLDE